MNANKPITPPKPRVPPPIKPKNPQPRPTPIPPKREDQPPIRVM